MRWFRGSVVRGCVLFLLAVVISVQSVHGQRPDVTGLLLTWQQDHTTTMTIDWRYYVGASGTSTVDPGVYYRPLGSVEWVRAEGQLITPSLLRGRARYRTELTSLSPHTTYEFRLAENERIFRFRTMPRKLAEPLVFAVGGDTMRDSTDWMNEMNRVVMDYDPEFIVWGGDLAHADDVMPDRWMIWFDAILNTLIAEDGRVVPIITAIGNHEVRNFSYQNHQGFEPTDEWRQRIAMFFYSLLAWPGQPGYGVLDFGDYLSLVILDTDHTNPIDGTQAAWLNRVLAERKHIAHVIAVYHVAAYPSARSIDGVTQRRIRQHRLPLFERYGVRLAFEHHDHAYKRTIPILDGKPHEDGIVFIGDGGWGVTVREVHPVESTWYLARAESVRSAIIVTLSRDAARLTAVSHAGNVIDEYTVRMDTDRRTVRTQPDGSGL